MYKKFCKEPGKFPAESEQVSRIADKLDEYISNNRSEIEKVHTLNANSKQIQSLVEVKLRELHFESEKDGLFDSCKVRSLRPDFYLKVGSSGILVEYVNVEAVHLFGY